MSAKESKAAAAPRPPKPGDPVRFEGERYEYSGPEPGAATNATLKGWGAFHRPAKLGKGDTTYKRVRCEIHDLTWSDDHKAFVLPGRGVEVADVKNPKRKAIFIEDGLPAAMAEQRVHAYLGRV